MIIPSKLKKDIEALKALARKNREAEEKLFCDICKAANIDPDKIETGYALESS